LTYLKDIIQKSSSNRYSNAVILSTIHSSKGLEFDGVFLIDLVDGQFPSAVSIAQFEEGINNLYEEEVRLFYVAITRAKDHLEILTFNNSNKRKIQLSRFVNQLYNANNSTLLEGIYSLTPNSKVSHSKFGIGNVIDISPKEDKIKIKFDKYGTKSLSIKICIDGGFLKIL
jgi:DNA helicase-2/ATP-dependent DNA helicase PcrA